ncbi:hypothetical protein C8F04DRAFT_550927 [Mycena alexandri]|uniref:Fungal-type protein kinase domain-containing protein n=1 Tax=Mycena alexandri TaxID=1745969 RepID=A0AAD6SW22_9AGAR|nr:hypothetical protein C8F04DRAFT_550927 [Mycena alexandri]
MLWWKALQENFRGEVSVDDFLQTYLPQPVTETDGRINAIIAQSATALKLAAKQARKAKKEVEYDNSIVAYFNAVVSEFPPNTKPLFKDTHSIMFPPIDEDDHPTAPDIMGGRPGAPNPDQCRWRDAGVIIELKVKVDIFKNGEVNTSTRSLDALAQIGKSARSLLASGNCFVFVVTVFKTDARILRFDRAGYRTSVAFNWTSKSKVFPTLFWRLYNPDTPNGANPPARMYGADDTISIPTAAEKKQMFKLWQETSSYKGTPSDKRLSLEAATEHSRWVDGLKDGLPVRCFTIGPVLFQSEGLFSRATRVDCVVIEGDKSPTVYALKDAWRQVCRRPETDFYDVIAKHCEETGVPTEGMARCLGSLDLSGLGHRTNSARSPEEERCHMRSLLTPVGLPLRNFTSSLVLVRAMQTAIQHHKTAYEAGVIHRDVSEGNVLLNERSMQGFLVDWDYAEFTAEGQRNFQKWFPERANSVKDKVYTRIDKSLKDRTGTFAFMAIQILDNKVTHEAKHDLESFYYLLIWMILRHTASDAAFDKPRVCHELFDNPAPASIKSYWVSQPLPFTFVDDHPLFDLVESFHHLVNAQYPKPENISRSRITLDITFSASPLNPVDVLTYGRVARIFEVGVALPNWPNDDKAIPFVPYGKAKDAKGETQSRTGTGTGNLRRTALQNSQAARGVSEGNVSGSTRSAKRRRDGEDVTASPRVSVSSASDLSETSGEMPESAPRAKKRRTLPELSGTSKERPTASASGSIKQRMKPRAGGKPQAEEPKTTVKKASRAKSTKR